MDTQARAGDRLVNGYDPLLAKVIAHQDDAAAPTAALDAALGLLRVTGARTNAGQLRAALAEPLLPRGDLTTAWWDTQFSQASAVKGDSVAGCSR